MKTENTLRFLAVAGVAAAVACATSQKQPDTFGSGANNGSSSGSGSVAGSNSGSVSGGGLSQDNGDATLGGGLTSADNDSGSGTMTQAGVDAAGFSLSADGSVVGTCVVGRTCDPMCDQLIENGVHSYTEMNPDDGSQLPPTNVATLFTGMVATSDTAGGPPCVTEPQNGAIYPNNWLRPRIAYTAPTGEVYFRIDIHADRQQNDLVVYTGSKTWELPDDIWKNLAASTWGEDITVTVSAVGKNGGLPVTATPVKFQIAPANANGSMIYWAAVGDENGGFSWLEGFRVGDDNVSQVLTVDQVQEKMSRDTGGNLQTTYIDPPLGGTKLANGTGSVQCIGCHVAVPDGESVAFHDFYPWPGVAAEVNTGDGGAAGAIPPWFTPGGQEAVALPWIGMMTFSPQMWAAGQHWVVAGLQVSSTEVPWQGGGTASPSSLVWIDMSTTQPLFFAGPDGGPEANLMGQNMEFVTANLNKSYGYLATTGDPNGSAACPTWSHDGSKIVYASNTATQDGRLAQGKSDLYTVPFNNGMGGAAKPLQGAADSTANEYYPWFSPDDKYIAYDRADPTNPMYYNPAAEVYVVPSAGGTATRLAANDPPACTGAKSPGVTNSWPRWSPEYPTCNGSTYYWLVFSSARNGVMFNT
ncbi:MAG TPA: hypothetical protein VK841_21835, partial [Polyangiaceae bacterium]|nr:hypothetical protein [Polyangiaceae bacterium]